jgi:D-inositol-3-phosphate glycosyltransferase
VKRILAIGHAQDGSGCARIMRGILGGLCHSFDVHQIGLNGFGSQTTGNWTRHECHDPNDNYGFDEFRVLFSALQPDIVFILQDLWIVPGYLEIIEGSPVPVAAYIPLDGQLARAETICALRTVDHLVTYLPWAREQMHQAFAQLKYQDGLPTPQVHSIPHGIDLGHFYPVACARTKLFPERRDLEDAFIVLNANQNRPRKQLDVTIEAFARFAHNKPDNVRLYLHAAPEGCVALRAEAERFGVGERLILTGESGHQHPVVTDERLNWIYNACDVGVNTSAGEGWGLVSFEHGSTGVAQIVPRHSACADLWEGAAELVDAELEYPCWQSPLRFSHISVAGVAAAMERIYADVNLRRKLGDAARIRATSPAYSWPVVSAQWLHLFEQVCSGG